MDRENRSGSERPPRKQKRNVVKKITRMMQTRLLAVFITVVVLLFGLNIVLSVINIKDGNPYKIQVLQQQQYKSTTINYKRGNITDRNGNVLATSVKVYNLILDPRVILGKEEYLQPTVDALTKCFTDLSEEDIKNTISEKKNSSYVVMIKQLSYEQVKPFMDIQDDYKNNPNVQGVWFENEYQRKYPYNSLGCSVLGFANSSNYADVGIEGFYTDTLNGTDGREYGFLNDDNDMEKIIKEAKDGDTVISTIDMKIQQIVEKKIAAYQKSINSKGISVIVANPNNGEILAMASDKSYDLNNPRDLTSFYSEEQINEMSDEEKSDALNEIWRNNLVTDTFEPGSTMKPFTVAAALEEGVATKDSTYVCTGSETIGKTTIKCHKEDGHGTISLQQTITYSCNSALMQIGLKMGVNLFLNYQNRFGFGQKTGIDLPNESTGILYSSDKMEDVDLACNAFGQNFTLNMIQMTAGFSSLINGGKYYTPHVVKQIVNSNGGLVENVNSNVVKQTVTADTSEFIKDALRTVVLDGTGAKAVISGYDVGGKTGTAEKLPRGKDEYVLSFIGCVPCDKPEVVCYVVIDTPSENPSDSGYAAELFNKIMKEVLPYMNIWKSDSSDKKAETETTNANSNEGESYPSGGFSDGNAGNGVVDEEGNYGVGEETTTEYTESTQPSQE